MTIPCLILVTTESAQKVPIGKQHIQPANISPKFLPKLGTAVLKAAFTVDADHGETHFLFLSPSSFCNTLLNMEFRYLSK